MNVSLWTNVSLLVVVALQRYAFCVSVSAFKYGGGRNSMVDGRMGGFDRIMHLRWERRSAAR